jgi:hypothetical protein
MDAIAYLYSAMDAVLMHFYRLPDNPLAGYFLGTMALALACVVLGKWSASLAFRANRGNILRDNEDIRHFQSLSIEAAKAGDKSAYKACNGIANDSFGKSFFTWFALAASSLWPVFFALGWMQYRFSEVRFDLPFHVPGVGNAVGYLATFVLFYVASRMLVGKATTGLKSLKTHPPF